MPESRDLRFITTSTRKNLYIRPRMHNSANNDDDDVVNVDANNNNVATRK